MSYKSILVNIDIDGPVAPLVKAAVNLAHHHNARLIGLCAADTPAPLAFPEGGAFAVDAWQQMRDDIEARFRDINAEFDALTMQTVETEWRDSLSSPTHALVEASRAADLVIMSGSHPKVVGDSYRLAEPGGVVLRAGRPILIVGYKVESLATDRMIVAWKDTREARRAIADAVPLLASATDVAVVSVASRADDWIKGGLDDVTAFLTAHGVPAKPTLIESPDEYIALFNFIDAWKPGLIVSGAYGNSRLREWAFGGVTRSLLEEAGYTRFLSS